MATPLISHPFRLTAGGSVATHEDGTEEYYAERLALLILTKPGERVLVPSFGLRDPTFDEVDDAMLAAQIELFGPPVTIASIGARPINDVIQEVIVEFDMAGEEEVGEIE